MLGWLLTTMLRLSLMLSCGCCLVGVVAVGVLYPFPVMLVIGLLWWRQKTRYWPTSDAHGTARTASVMDLLYYRLLGKTGVNLGRIGNSERPTRREGVRVLFSRHIDNTLACNLFISAVFKGSYTLVDHFIRVRDYVHLSTFSPAGGGKTVSVLAPNLLEFPGSCVVIDIKDGELFKITAKLRQAKLGQRVYRLDPYYVCGDGGDRYNPLDFVFDNMPDLLEICRDIGNQLVVRTGMERERNWDDNAESLLAVFTFLVCMGSPLEERNFDTIRDILSNRQFYEWTLRKLRDDADSPLTRRLGNLVGWLQDRELHSVMSNVHRHTQWMDSPLVSACMKRSTFDPNELRTNRQSVTLYVVLPANLITVMQPWIRMVIGTLLRILTRNGGDERRPVLFFIDEAGHLGQMKALETAITLSRGAGIRLWFFWQSIDQLKECYGERADIVLANMGTQQYFNIRDTKTAEELSKRIGDQTVSVVSRNVTTSRSRPTQYAGPHAQGGSISDSTSFTTSELARRLLKPEEILRLPNDVGLTFHKNLPVIPTKLIKYYADREYRNGGTGNQRGLGIQACFISILTLFASSIFLGVALILPVSAPRRIMVLPPVPAQGYGDTPFNTPPYSTPIGGLIGQPPPSPAFVPYRNTTTPPIGGWNPPDGFYDPRGDIPPTPPTPAVLPAQPRSGYTRPNYRR